MSEKEKYLPKCECFEEPNSPMLGLMVGIAQTMGRTLTSDLSEIGLCRATWQGVLDMTIINTMSIHVCEGTALEPGTPETQFELKEQIKMMSDRLLEKVDYYYEMARAKGMTHEKFQAMQQAAQETKQ